MFILINDDQRQRLINIDHITAIRTDGRKIYASVIGREDSIILADFISPTACKFSFDALVAKLDERKGIYKLY